jgi:PAS domain S-box-containing protein
MTDPHAWLIGSGEMSERTRAFDWSTTPVGPIGRWPQSLRTTVSIMLGCQYPLLIWWGPELIHFYNDAYLPVLGKRHPGALGRPAPQVWSEAWPLVGPQADAVMRDGKSHWNEELLIVMTRNGYPEEVYMTFSYGPIMDDAGKVGGVFCACTEETPRVLARRRLATLRSLADRSYQARSAEEACTMAAGELAKNANDLPFARLYLLSADGRSARLAGQSGLDEVTAARATIVDVQSDDDSWRFREVMATGRLVELDALAERLGSVSGSPWPEPVQHALVLPMIKPGQQQLAGFFVAGVSPRLPLDESYRTFLGLVAAQAATAVGNAQAYEQERRRAEALAELDRAKTAFFSNVSHEFRTPLTLMLGPLQDVLAANGVPQPLHEQVSIAHRNALRLLKLVNTMLDVSRIESGRVQASYEPTNLAQFTAELASTFRSAIERAGMRLAVDCPALPEPVWVDRDMWEKIVLNLLSNAFKFSFEGEIAVSVLPAGEGQVELVVRDTGTGIPAADLPRIFERFHRIRGARARSHEGSGIGLALVQDLVKLHGGTIDVASTPGQGTCFTVRIPSGSAHLPQERLASSRPRSANADAAAAFVGEAVRWLPGGTVRTTPRADGEGSSILLADDNADMRDYVSRLLAGSYRVETVADGESALRRAREGGHDLVLADIMMPGIDGLALLRALRDDPRTREMPVILLSARAGEESKVEGLDAGADDYLVKPFTARELLARVKAHIELARERRRTADELSGRVADLKQANADIRDARRATLNILEDAVQARDLAERLYGEMRERESWMRGQSRALAAAVDSAPLQESLGVLVSTAVEAMGPDVRAAFYLANGDKTSLHHVVGMSDEYAEQVDGLRIGPESLACGLATHTGEPVVTTDVHDDPRWVPWQWLAERFDYRGCWSFPVHSAAGRHIGTLAIYSRSPRSPTGRDHELARLLTNTAAIIISRHTEADVRRVAEQRLRESEERFRALVEPFAQAVWEADANGLVVTDSPSWRACTGQALEQWLGEGWIDAVHPGDRAHALRQWHDALRAATPLNAQFRLRSPHGEWRWTNVRAAPIRDGDGRIIKWVAMNIDITAQKGSEAAMAEGAAGN